MLEELTVSNFALIDRVSVRFSTGLNVLSGETGAGKSILIGAMGLLLGMKGETQDIRTGFDEAMASAFIRVSENPRALQWLAERDIQPEDGGVMVRRVLRRTGRGSIYIQSTPATRSDLQALTSSLFDLHGQHQHQSLLDARSHRVLLDKYGNTLEAADALHEQFAKLSGLRRQREKMLAGERERFRELDILKFAVQEIDEAGLSAGEEEELEQERSILSQHERLYALLDEAYEAMAENRGGALAKLRTARDATDGIVSIDGSVTSLAKRIEDAFFELEDVAESLRQYQSGISFTPERLDAVEERLAAIRRLEKKYGNSIQEVLDYAEEAREQIHRMENWEEDRAELEESIKQVEKQLLAEAHHLSAERKKAAEVLQEKIRETLQALGMPKAEFRVEVSERVGESGRPSCGPHGIDNVEFTISPNPGEPPKPLQSIASGGEISRVMLAIKSVLAATDDISCLIFDEIDAGIGGEVAIAVGEHLHSLARHTQVLCITHLATIAVRADNHIKIEKVVSEERTTTKVTQIEGRRKIEEVARMLAGDRTGELSLTHAEEMLRKYRAL
jgi:DNA repair protein RecN (Recombination protein N)